LALPYIYNRIVGPVIPFSVENCWAQPDFSIVNIQLKNVHICTEVEMLICQAMEVFNNSNQVESWNQFIKDGDLDSLSQVYFHYYDLLFSYGLNITSDKQLVEDAIQNVFLSCIKSRKNISNSVRSLKGYLISSFRRELFNSLGQKRKTLFSADITIDQFDCYKIHDQDSIDENEFEKLHQVIKKCISNLPSRQQEIFYLRFDSEISYEEIAQIMDISIDSCYKTVYRAIKTIREEAEKIMNIPDSLVFFILSNLSYKELL
jgi:RNA polymerase sigma factor (sigma-70 family)